MGFLIHGPGGAVKLYLSVPVGMYTLYFSVPVELYTVLLGPKTLVKALVKNLAKHLVKNLAKIRACRPCIKNPTASGSEGPRKTNKNKGKTGEERFYSFSQVSLSFAKFSVRFIYFRLDFLGVLPGEDAGSDPLIFKSLLPLTGYLQKPKNELNNRNSEIVFS